MRDAILNLLEKKGDLPPLPEILLRLQNKVRDPKVSISDIAKIIEMEPVLAGRILNLANSAFYSRGFNQIKTLSLAIGKLGLREIIKMVYSIELTKIFIDSTILDYSQFWRHSLSVAIFSQTLSRRIKSLQEEQEIDYLAGLMHDVGIMVFGYLIPDEYMNFLKKLMEKEEPLEVQEKNYFGIEHAELGALFIEKWWHIDNRAVQGVKYHHFPFHGTGKERLCEQLINVANGLCNNQGITNGITCYTEVFKEGAWESLGLSLEEAENMIKDIHASLNEAIIFVGYGK